MKLLNRWILFGFLLVVALSFLGCAGKQIENPTVNDTIYKVFETTQKTYTIAHGSIVRVSKIANGIGVIACKENKESAVCKASKGYAKVYKEKLYPASVNADDAYKDAQKAANAYLDGTEDGASLEQHLRALADAMDLFQKYFDDSEASEIVNSIGVTGGDQ